MDEIRKNHIVQIITQSNAVLEGIVCDYTNDRVMVLIADDYLLEAKKIKELDELDITANTHLGLKRMKSSVISELNSQKCIIIENNPSVPVVQKREFVRVLSNINFDIIKNNTLIKCVCINISAGGIAFHPYNAGFNISDEVIIKFSKDDFEKEIECKAVIIKAPNDYYVAKYLDLSAFDEDKIVKHVFKLITKK